MKQRIQKKVEQWQQEPEDRRRRRAVLLTVSGGVVVTAIWLVVLLPFQLSVSRGTFGLPRVGGARTEATPTPTPTPTPTVNPSLLPVR